MEGKAENQNSKPQSNEYQTLKAEDEELYRLLMGESVRQFSSIELIASENFVSKNVRDTLALPIINCDCPALHEYAEKELLDIYGINEEEWGVNLHPGSGSPANFEAYNSLMEHGDHLLGMQLASGGHLTHGHQTQERKFSTASYYFNIDQNTGLLDYEEIEAKALEHKPKVIIAGYSAYSRDLDYKRFQSISKAAGSLLLVDMAHYSGLVIGNIMNSPFPYADIVTTTTHKSFKGPRHGLIFYRKSIPNIKHKLDRTILICGVEKYEVAPINEIAAILGRLEEIKEDLRDQGLDACYGKKILENARTLAEYLMDNGAHILTNGTENHLFLWNLKPYSITGSKFEKICDKVSISLNKNCIVGDKSPMTPSGVRIGTAAMTSRGCGKEQFIAIATFLLRAIQLAQQIQAKSGKKLVHFVNFLQNDEEVLTLRDEIIEFARSLPMPGICVEELNEYIKIHSN